MEVPKTSREAMIEDLSCRAGYFVARSAVIVVLATTAVMSLYEHEHFRDTIFWLDYPDYVLHFVGLANIAAIFSLLFSRFERLTEWTYAGIAIELLLAGYSHFRIGDYFAYTYLPFAVLGIVVCSYVLRPEIRPWLKAHPPPFWGEHDRIR